MHLDGGGSVKIRSVLPNDIPTITETLIDLSLIDDGVNMRSDVERLTEPNEELVQSIIANNGVLQSIGVFPSGERFTLIFGQRRVHCSRIAGMTSIRARIFAPPQDDADRLVIGIHENGNRVDANPVEFAEALKKIKQVRNWTSDDVARAVCLKPVKVCRLLQLADQSDALKQLVRDGRLGLTPALELGKVPLDEQQALIDQIAEGTVTRERLIGLRKSRQDATRSRGDRTVPRGIRRAVAPLPQERSVTVADARADLNMEKFIVSVEECLHKARKARSSGMTLVTFLRMLSDLQTTGPAEGTV